MFNNMLSSPRIDLHLSGDAVSIDEEVHFARAAESAGFGAVWTGEAFRETFVPLALVAAATNTVQVGTNIAQWSRTLPAMEAVAANLHQHSGARFTLGIGSMPRSWNEDWHGIPYVDPLGRMREYVAGVRALWTASQEEPVSVVGDHFQVRDYTRFQGSIEGHIPIQLAATRRGMAALAGEIADGVSFNTMLPSRYISEIMVPAVVKGIDRRADHSRPHLMATAMIAVSDDRREARKWARHPIAFHAKVAGYFDEVMAYLGFSDELNQIRTAMDIGHEDEAIELVPDGMVDALCLAGNPDDVRRELSRFRGVVDSVALYPPTWKMTQEEVKANHYAAIEAFAV